MDRGDAMGNRALDNPIIAIAGPRGDRGVALGPCFRILAPLSFMAVSAHLEAAVPTPDHVVVVIEENHSKIQIYGSALAPYINNLANQGVAFTQSFAITHPSQPNYLALFSGSTQGVLDDKAPHAFTSPNLGASIISKGLSFGAYSEDLPSIGSLVSVQGKYAGKHNPWINWQDAATNGIPAADNMPMTSFPSDYTRLPTVSFVIPNLLNDMHDGTVERGDAWLHDHLDGYAQWAKTHRSMLVITWDEDDRKENNQILTVLFGADVKVGPDSEHITHYNILRTIEDMYGLAHFGATVDAKPISECWAPSTPVNSH
jgi:phosphatidylinositol-3-phosphatase